MIGGFVDIFPSKVSLNPGYFFRVSSRVPRNPYLLAHTCQPVVVWKHAFNFQFRFYQVLSRYIKFYKVESNSSNAMKITNCFTIENCKFFRNLSFLKLKTSQDYMIMLHLDHLNFTILLRRIFMKSPTHFLTFFSDTTMNKKVNKLSPIIHKRLLEQGPSFFWSSWPIGYRFRRWLGFLLCRSRASSSPVPWSQSRPIPSPRPLQSKPIKIKPSSCISYIKIKL